MDANRTELLEAFEALLEREQQDASVDSKAALGDRQTDLFTVLSELAALKNEVHLESRQFKSALDSIRQLTDTLQSERDTLTEQVKQARVDAKRMNREALKPLLSQLLDLYDRLDAGLKAAERYQPKGFALRGRRHERAMIEAMRQGQELTLRRLEQLLASYDVQPISVVDKELDPHAMRASEIDHRADIADGVVTAELRKGFQWGNEVLRTAEVKVNRRVDPRA